MMESSREHKGHAHRFTLRTGEQIVSSVSDDGPDHEHEVRGTVTSKPIPVGDDHMHTLIRDFIEVESGPSIPHAEAKQDMDDHGTGLGSTFNKSMLPDLVDPNHTYIFRSGDCGLYDYWYIDQADNYWRYTNAPEDSPDYDPMLGVAVMAPDQPTPEEHPQFYTAAGQKRHIGVPMDVLVEENENYSPVNSREIWFEKYEREGETRYVYLDTDVRENLDLWVQYQLRVTDANIPKYRQFAIQAFNNPHPKDKVLGAILMLMDQGLYELESLLNATVSDLQFIDSTVRLLGRKFNADPELLDFLTSLTAGRDPESPLFVITSIEGEGKVGTKYVASVLKYLRVSPVYLLCWHASHIYSRVLNRLAFEDVDPAEIDGMALSEVKRSFGTNKDLQYMIDVKLRQHLLENYEDRFEKSIIPRVDSDDFSTLLVFSDLMGRKPEEVEFSSWLHAQPMHDITFEEQQAIDEALAVAEEEAAEAEAEGESDVADQEAGAVDSESTGEV